MAHPKTHAEYVRRLRDGGGVIPRDTGEAISFPNRAVREQMGEKYRLDSKDEGEAKRGLDKFKRSSDYKRFSPYKRRFY